MEIGSGGLVPHTLYMRHFGVVKPVLAKGHKAKLLVRLGKVWSKTSLKSCYESK